MKLQQLKDQLNSIYLGKPDVIDLCLTALIAEGHILLEDVPGTGKTMLAKALAQSFESAFSRIQFTADLLPSDVIGSGLLQFKDTGFENKRGPLFANVVLIDEINRAFRGHNRHYSKRWKNVRSRLVERPIRCQPHSSSSRHKTRLNRQERSHYRTPNSTGSWSRIEVGYPDFENERRLLSEILTNVRRSAVGIASGAT